MCVSLLNADEHGPTGRPIISTMDTSSVTSSLSRCSQADGQIAGRVLPCRLYTLDRRSIYTWAHKSRRHSPFVLYVLESVYQNLGLHHLHALS